MANPYIAELAKPENDALRVAGDVIGIMARYNELIGAPTWVNVHHNEVTPLIETSMDAWDNADFDEFWKTHVLGGNKKVRLSLQTTRDFLQPLVAVDEWAAVESVAKEQERRYENAGLPPPARNRIERALQELTDTPQYEAKESQALIKRIRQAGRDGELNNTSFANLQTIDSLIGT